MFRDLPFLFFHLVEMLSIYSLILPMWYILRSLKIQKRLSVTFFSKILLLIGPKCQHSWKHSIWKKLVIICQVEFNVWWLNGFTKSFNIINRLTFKFWYLFKKRKERIILFFLGSTNILHDIYPSSTMIITICSFKLYHQFWTKINLIFKIYTEKKWNRSERTNLFIKNLID